MARALADSGRTNDYTARVQLVFDAQGSVDRVAGSAGLSPDIREAFRTVQVQGVTGGWVVVSVSTAPRAARQPRI